MSADDSITALAVSVESLPSAHGQIDPVCMCFRTEPFAYLAHTEWHTAAIAPHFATMLLIDSKMVRNTSGQEAPMRLQIRQVTDPFWDETPASFDRALRAMPLLGHCTITLEAARAAAESGMPLSLIMSVEGGPSGAQPSFKVSVRAFTCKRGGPWGQPNVSDLHHSCVNYRFGDGGGQVQARVTERMLCNAAGYEVPLAVLRMLSEDAHRQALARAGWPSSAALKPGMHDADESPPDDRSPPANAAHASGAASVAPRIELDWEEEEQSDPNRLLGGCLSAVGWAWHARWVDQALAQLRGAFQSEHGFKPSVAKASAALAAMPINLMLNVLEVQDEPHETHGAGSDASPLEPAGSRRRHVAHATVSSGAFAAHSLGFSDGGAAEYESRLHAFSCVPEAERASRRPKAEALALSYAKRIALLSCQAYAAVAVSFAASCREQALRSSCHGRSSGGGGCGGGEWFARLRALGYLIQVESLLTTRGEEWGMLQDLQVACRLLSRVCIEVRGEAGTPVTTTVAETLATSREMAPAAEAMAPTADTPVPKAEATAPVADVAALAIDDPAELAEAPAPATTADKAASAGVPTTHNADGATAGPEGTGSEARSAPVDASADADAGADAGTDADAVVDWMWQRGDIAIKGSRRSPILEMSAEALGFRDAAHAAAMGLPPGTRIPVRAVLFTQGINEDQSMASVMRTHTSDQQAINQIATRRVRAYVAAAARMATGAAYASEATHLLEKLDSAVRLPAETKNVAILEHAAALTRRLGGGRVTMCKSGKDRTSMSLTLEHGRLLHACHGLPARMAPAAVHTMRRRGVRRDNVQFNTSKRLYAFNWLQQTMLPEPYRPPEGSAKGGKG